MLSPFFKIFGEKIVKMELFGYFAIICGLYLKKFILSVIILVTDFGAIYQSLSERRKNTAEFSSTVNEFNLRYR